METTTTNNLKATLTVPESAAFLGIGKTFAYQLIHEPGFPAFKIGGKILVDRARLEQWKEERLREGI